MEQHQKCTVNHDDRDAHQGNISENSPSTLAEFSKNYLNQKSFSDVPTHSNNKMLPSFVIPKLRGKPIENCDGPCLIDLSSALKAVPEASTKSCNRVPFTNDKEVFTLSRASEDIFLELNFDSIKILNNDLELSNKSSSPFGKILCRKWKFNNVNLVKRENVSPTRVVHFDFSTPSPDDLILKFIRRK